LMDVRMPGRDGLEATRELLRESPKTHVLILTTFDLNEYVYEAMRAGASGFLLKDIPRSQLIEGVRTVARGEALLAPTITKRLIEQFVRRPPASVRPSSPKLDALTAREREVLQLVARGRSNAEIATALYVSDATVKTHVAHALAKLDLRDRVQAVVFAYESGLIEPGDD
jgi:DNA-binding NarL/FixJ family response regulator